MVVGSGLIAKQFEKWKDRQDVVIFASGVSNSKETRNSSFHREMELIKKFSSLDAIFVYFSSCSVFDESLSESPYVLHKRRVEEYLELNCKAYLVLRLPNLIGVSDNPYTFFNFFFKAISSKSTLILERFSTRYFLDIDIIEPIVRYCVYNNYCLNSKINVFIGEAISVCDAVLLMSSIMNVATKVEVKDMGNSYIIPEENFFELRNILLSSKDLNDYYPMLFRKYIKMNLT